MPSESRFRERASGFHSIRDGHDGMSESLGLAPGSFVRDWPGRLVILLHAPSYTFVILRMHLLDWLLYGCLLPRS